MNCYRCPACGMDGIVYIGDSERDLTVLRCRECGETFAVSNIEAYFNGVDWVLGEWAISLASQRSLCEKGAGRWTC